MRYLAPALLLLSACGPGEQPAPPVSELRPPTDTITLNDTELTDAIWLGGDRWAILAPAAKTIRVLDLASKRVETLGRPGKDYTEPFAIFRSGDSLYVDDWGMRQVTGWSLEGRLARRFPAPAPFRGALPRARDNTGAWYAELRPFPGPDGSGNRDSGVVVRWSDGASTDTMVHLAPYQMEPVTREGARRYERLILSGLDQWGVGPDGMVWVARVNDNLIEHCALAHTPCSAGPPLRDKVLVVTLQDREYFMESFPAEQRSLIEEIPFAIIKPPFSGAFAAPDGGVWLERSRLLTDSTRSYQLLGRDGKLIRELRLPNAQQVLGSDGTHLLAIDPLVPGPGHRVLRYPIPAAADTVMHQ